MRNNSCFRCWWMRDSWDSLEIFGSVAFLDLTLDDWGQRFRSRHKWTIRDLWWFGELYLLVIGKVDFPVLVEIVTLSPQVDICVSKSVWNRLILSLELIGGEKESVSLLSQTHQNTCSYPCADIWRENALRHFDILYDWLEWEEFVTRLNKGLDLLNQSLFKARYHACATIEHDILSGTLSVLMCHLWRSKANKVKHIIHIS